MKNTFDIIGTAIQSLMINTGCRYRKRAIFLGGAVLLFLTQSLLASGIIRGKVYDKDTNDPLPGANVYIKGTSIGTATDLKGTFYIPNAPAGPMTIVVSYIGYETMSILVRVPEGGSVYQDFELGTVVVQGERVVVTAQAMGQIQAINQQLASNKVVNIVSEARIQELPDFNAAQAISRLPGVSTLESSGEANKVVIRGLAPQFNAVSIEGVNLASTGSTQIGAVSQPGMSRNLNTDRSVDLSMISPYMVQSISVYKSLTPDLNANAIGGVVNMALREAPSGLHTDILFNSGYTQKSGNFGNYRAVASASNRFFNEKLGAYILVNAEAYDRDAENMDGEYSIERHQIGENGFEPVQVDNVKLNRHIENRKRYGGNLILDYQLPGGYLKSINMFSRLHSDYQDHRTILDYKNKNIDFSYRGGENDIDMAVNTLEFSYDFGLFSMDIKGANTYSRNNLPESPYLQFRQTGGIVGNVPENTIPDSLTRLAEYRGSEATFLNTVTIFSTEYKENNKSLKSNLQFPFTIGQNFSGYIKFGGEYQHRKHTNDQATPYFSMGRGSQIQRDMIDSLVAIYGIDYDQATGQFAASSFTTSNNDLMGAFLDNRFGTFYWAGDPGIIVDMGNYVSGTPDFSGTNVGGWFDGLYQNLPNDYTYIEKYYAGYLMSELNFQNVTVVVGMRYEKVNSQFDAFNLADARDPRTQTAIPVTVYPKNEFWLPMGQIRYKPFDWVDVRYAYTQTLARPDYHQLSPHVAINYDKTSLWAGNPDLKPAHALNHDLILTFHSNQLGLLAIGGFYKTIKDFAYYTEYKLHPTAPAGLKTIHSFDPSPKDGAKLYTYVNSDYDGKVKGLELDLQTSFWYLPFPLNKVVCGINYTRIWSEATYPWRDDVSYPNPNPPPRRIVTVLDSTRIGRLIYQPNDILNAYFGLDYGGFSIRMSFIFQGNSVSYIGAFQEQDGFTRDYFRMDLSAKQKLPWEGLEIYLDVTNLNNEINTSAQRSIGGFTRQQNYGLVANGGIRFRL